ncbi:MAG: hypothetical protein Q7V62_06910, partial [Actinomycetota bacterium]|nr:hypothetical protein [Actinomycetota bacterium]
MTHQWSQGTARHPSGAVHGLYDNYSNSRAPKEQSMNSAGVEPYGRFTPFVKNLENFFGEPRPSKKALAMDEVYEKENSDYPEAFHLLWNDPGRSNSHVATMLLEKTKASENWQLTRMAPWQLKDGGLGISWNEVRYHKHMLDREPEESVPRLMTSTRTQGSAQMVRYGIALLLEATFASTPAGVHDYHMNIEQIKVATVETCSYGVMVSVLCHVPFQDTQLASSATNQLSDMSKLNEMFQEECAAWGIVHKQPNGYDRVKTKLRKIMSSRPMGKDGNFTVVPAGMGAFLQHSHDAKFYLEGRSDSRNIGAEQALSHTVVESRMFSMGEKSLGHDPCFRHQTVGGFLTLDDSSLVNVAASEYRTHMLDSVGFNLEADKEHRFRYAAQYLRT